MTSLYRLSECLFYLAYLRGSLALFSFLAQSLERDFQTRVRENADLQQQVQTVAQQLSRKEAELTRAEETIGREQQQIQELREQV